MGEQIEPIEESGEAEPQGKCPACGYDLRGSVSPVCPECGVAKEWRRLSFFELDDFQQAKLILEEAKIPVRAFDAGLGQAGLTSLYGGGMKVYEIGVLQRHLQEARTVLQANGISVPAPFVNREEPFCPSCGERMDPDGPERCPHCDTAFCWADQFEDESRPSSQQDEHGEDARRSWIFVLVSRLMGLICIGALSAVISIVTLNFISEADPAFWGRRTLIAGYLVFGFILWLFLSTFWVFRPMLKAKKAGARRSG
ncbi:MAG: hypothetical protein JSV91_11515 [Phycisphaerales bacterium]|nr:MAG: hypothetical protein JSV91_11515 [Phycisphaerales bacterium]